MEYSELNPWPYFLTVSSIIQEHKCSLKSQNSNKNKWIVYDYQTKATKETMKSLYSKIDEQTNQLSFPAEDNFAFDSENISDTIRNITHDLSDQFFAVLMIKGIVMSFQEIVIQIFI